MIFFLTYNYRVNHKVFATAMEAAGVPRKHEQLDT